MTIDTLLNQESITHQYERIRLDNKNLTYQRREEISSKFPRIAEIDKELGKLRFEYMKMKLKKHDVDSGIDDISLAKKLLNEKVATLISEKTSILTNAGYPANYLDEIFTCKKCEDTGYVDGRRCECFSIKIVDNLYRQSNLKSTLENENFSTFRTDFYSQESMPGKTFTPYENIVNVVDKLKKYIDGFDTNFTDEISVSNNIKPNILFFGETGLGKTFLTNCVAKEILDSGHSVLYLSANDIFENLIGNYIMRRANELEDLYKLVYNCELLIIDDLGTEYKNDFSKSQLFEVINKRSLDNLATIISTNYDIKRLDESYSQRIVSRFIENYNIFNIYGNNIRYAKRRQIITE